MKNQQKRKNSLYLIIISSLLISCDSNQICFDIEKQMVYSKDNAKLRVLMINTEQGGELIWITKKDGTIANEYFSFEKMDTLNYLYEKSGNILKKTEIFHLKPNNTYEVENKSDGDATGGKLTIKTDNKAKVFYSSKICD